MSDALTLLDETADKLFAELVTPQILRASEAGGFALMLWQMIEKAGYPRALLAEERGGAGAGFAGAYPLMRASGFHAAPVPLAEALLATWLLDEAHMEIPKGVLTLADGAGLTLTEEGAAVRLSGALEAVPFARHAAHAVVGIPDKGRLAVVLIDVKGCLIERAENLAGEPRDRLRLAGAPAIAFARTALAADALQLCGALMRAGQMAGALERALALCLGYAGERRQFGRPIGSFQAVQHMLAELAEETAAASEAARAAFETAGGGGALALPAIAAAKIRAGMAAEKGAGLAHQIHGALGFTMEHPLHFTTRRLWAWRSEYGAERAWALLLGRQAAAQGGEGLWPFLTRAPERLKRAKPPRARRSRPTSASAD